MKKIFKFSLCIILMLVSIIFIYYHYKGVEIEDIDNNILANDNEDVVPSLIDEFENTDIIAKLNIPGVLETPVVQSFDNDYYVNHDIYNDENSQGAIFMDYKNKIDDKELIIYGHSNNPKTLVFNGLLNYKNEDFLKKHNKIYLRTLNGLNTYEIFSVCEDDGSIDFENFSDRNMNSYGRYINSVKNKSIFNTDININSNDRIIVLDLFLNGEEVEYTDFLVFGVLR